MKYVGDEPHATMDFETRSPVDLKKAGAYKYAQDARTEIMCLVYRLPGDPSPRLWHPWQDDEPDDLLEWVAAGGLVEAHNAEFEYCIWNYVGHRRLGWPRISITQLRCSAAKAAALALPRNLEELGVALRLKVTKDMAGRRLMLRMSKPRKVRKGEPPGIYYHEEQNELDRLFQYCETDVVTEELASDKMVPLIPRNQKVFELTQRMNERGIYCDTELCKAAVRFAAEFKVELEKDLWELTDGQVKTAKQNAAILKFLKSAGGLELPNLQAATVAQTLKEVGDFLDPIARRVLEIRQALAKSSITKYQSMLAMAGPDRRIRGTLLFHGASTGRYAGRGIQPQNYAKAKIKDVHNVFELLRMGDYEFFKTVFPDVFTALSAGLRGMLCAAPGKILYAADFAAIEARVVLWLAGDDENLKEYYTGADPYKTMAALIYGVKYEDVTKDQRELGKRAVLGCGFGMGVDKFFLTCETQGFPIPKKLAARAVKAYRQKYSAVREFWYELERCAITAVKQPGTVHKIGNLQWLYRGGYLFCQLPSGRRLAYAQPTIERVTFKYEVEETIVIDGQEVTRKKKVEKEKDQLCYWAVHPKTKKWSRERTYGGKLTENVVQATAADVMVDAMFRVENAGYPVIFTVHDEVICEAAESHGSLGEFEKLMSLVPKWADGLPIKVEGWRERRYKK